MCSFLLGHYFQILFIHWALSYPPRLVVDVRSMLLSTADHRSFSSEGGVIGLAHRMQASGAQGSRLSKEDVVNLRSDINLKWKSERLIKRGTFKQSCCCTHLWAHLGSWDAFLGALRCALAHFGWPCGVPGPLGCQAGVGWCSDLWGPDSCLDSCHGHRAHGGTVQGLPPRLCSMYLLLIFSVLSTCRYSWWLFSWFPHRGHVLCLVQQTKQRSFVSPNSFVLFFSLSSCIISLYLSFSFPFLCSPSSPDPYQVLH